jgi:hypothetical protein
MLDQFGRGLSRVHATAGQIPRGESAANESGLTIYHNPDFQSTGQMLFLLRAARTN